MRVLYCQYLKSGDTIVYLHYHWCTVTTMRMCKAFSVKTRKKRWPLALAYTDRSIIVVIAWRVY